MCVHGHMQPGLAMRQAQPMVAMRLDGGASLQLHQAHRAQRSLQLLQHLAYGGAVLQQGQVLPILLGFLDGEALENGVGRHMLALAAQRHHTPYAFAAAVVHVVAPWRGQQRIHLLAQRLQRNPGDRKSTRLNSSHLVISYAVFCLKKKKKQHCHTLAVNTAASVSSIYGANSTMDTCSEA